MSKKFPKTDKGSFNKKRSTKGKNSTTNRKGVKDTDNGIVGCNTNDPQWYAVTDQLLRDAASLPFSTKSGSPYVIYNANGSNYSAYEMSFPGIMKVVLAPTCGNPQSLSDPLNLAAADFFSFVRKNNSGSVNYGTANLMMYLLEMGSMYSLYGWVTRVYGVMNTYNPMNKFMPRAIIESMNIDFDDVMNNMANFRAAINMFAKRLNYFSTPKNMAYFDRNKMLYTHVYADEDNLKSQLYLFDAHAFYRYNEPGTSSANRVGTMTYSSITGTGSDGKITTQDIIDFMNDMIEPIVFSQDFSIMSGDIRKALNGENLTVVNEISEDYMVYPVIDEYILDQIHNSNTIFNEANGESRFTNILDTAFGTIGEDMNESGNAGALTMVNSYKAQSTPFTFNTIIDLETNAPTPADVMEATRLKSLSSSEFNTDLGGWVSNLGPCGLEVVLRYELYYYIYVGGVHTLMSKPLYSTNSDYLNIAMATCFKKAPIMAYAYNSSTLSNNDAGTVLSPLFGSIANWTTIDKPTLQRMNEVAALSLFTVRY